MKLIGSRFRTARKEKDFFVHHRTNLSDLTATEWTDGYWLYINQHMQKNEVGEWAVTTFEPASEGVNF